MIVEPRPIDAEEIDAHLAYKVLRTTSRFLNGKDAVVTRFHCPSCDAPMERPGFGTAGACPGCGLRVEVHSNGLSLWVWRAPAKATAAKTVAA